MINIYLFDYKLAGDFFLRIATADRQARHHFITTIPSAAFTDASRSVSSALISRFSKKSSSIPGNLGHTRDVAQHILSVRAAAALHRSIRYAIQTHVDSAGGDYSEVILHVWNGASIWGDVARTLKQELGVKTVFFEISNLPGKIFVDPEGVNAQSRLFRDPSILDRFPIEQADFQKWRVKFVEDKRNATSLPQTGTSRRIRPYHFSDFVYSLTLGYRAFTWSSVTTKLKSAFPITSRKKPGAALSASVALPDRYVFFPMQVSNDTQIVLNSHIDNIGALEYLARSVELPLVIKPHPAEYDINYIYDAVRSLAFRSLPVLTNANTIGLIDGAESVVTINSTTGLEALILGKPVQFLAKSFYAHLNNRNLGNYILGYLLDIDFFAPSDAGVSPKALVHIRERANV